MTKNRLIKILLCLIPLFLFAFMITECTSADKQEVTEPLTTNSDPAQQSSDPSSTDDDLGYPSTGSLDDRLDVPTSSVRLDVPLVEQFPLAPTGCEIASLTMLLQYAGYETTFEQSLEDMWYSTDPYEGFVGDPYSWDGGWTIYPEAAAQWIAERIGSAQILTGVSLEELRDVLRDGKPVVVWVYLPGIAEHCMCITGFDKNGFYLNDPYGTKDWFCDYELFELYWANYNRMALSY